jgi:hypothetical protein
MLLEVSRKLPTTSNRCSLVVAAWQKLSVGAVCGDQKTMHLWSHAMAVYEEKNFNEVEPGVRALLDRVTNSRLSAGFFRLSELAGPVRPAEENRPYSPAFGGVN